MTWAHLARDIAEEFAGCGVRLDRIHDDLTVMHMLSDHRPEGLEEAVAQVLAGREEMTLGELESLLSLRPTPGLKGSLGGVMKRLGWTSRRGGGPGRTRVYQKTENPIRRAA